MTKINAIDKYINDQLEQNLNELKKLVEIPSVSAKNEGLSECAQIVAELFSKRGFDIKIHPTKGAPIITARFDGQSDNTILFYNHYDVQPIEPLDLWESPPFEVAIREEKVFGRGTNDNKGNITNRLLAIDSLLSINDTLPCNVIFLIEGEEETSSVHLEEFVRENKKLLAADGCIWEFGAVDHNDIPLQYLGLRGICYVELEVETASSDAHSGLGGSIFPNSAWHLVWALASLKSPDEKILLPHFYDDVIPPSEEDKQYFSKIADSSKEYKTRYGIKEFLHGIENGLDLHIAEVFQPTCTICGLNSGYQGPGSKTVLPAKANAKIDFRLVPNQRPENVLKQLRDHLDKNAFHDVKINYLGGESPARTNPKEPFVQLVVSCAKDVYGRPMQIVPMTGGSGPNFFVQETLGVPIVSIGVGYPDSKAHAPNENFRIKDYINTARHLTRILIEFGKVENNK